MNHHYQQLTLETVNQDLHLFTSITENNETISSIIPISIKNVKKIRNNNYNSEEKVLSVIKKQNKKDEFNSSGSFWRENFFVNGSYYHGAWDTVGMAGIGRYILPNGTVFEGEFRDNKFHGNGTMSFPCGQSIDGVWINSKLKTKRYKFKDGLMFTEDNWKYCQFPDRRFYPCITNSLRPAKTTLETNRQPTKIIPFLSYDTGYGVYYPDIHYIISYDSKKIIEIPTKAKVQWIIRNCRKGFDEPTGYQPWLNENWSIKIMEDLNIEYCLPLSNDSPQHWWKRLSTFKEDTNIYRKDDDFDCKNCYRNKREKGAYKNTEEKSYCY